MLIKLITSDFKGSCYVSNEDCPLARALKRIFPKKKSRAGGTFVEVSSKIYKFMELGTIGLWDDILVTPLIQQANEGKEVSFELDIPGLTEQV